MNDFIDLPYRLYKDNPNWCPPIRIERKAFFSRKNSFMSHSEVNYFVAYENGQPVGRVTAHKDEIYNRQYRTQQGFFGFFECYENLETAGKLMAACENWARAQGMNSLLGPINFSTNHEIGFLIKGFDTPPMIMMPYTKEYYPGIMFKLGYAKEKELIAYSLNRTHTLPDFFVNLADKIARDYQDTVKIRTFHMNKLKSELKILLDIYNSAWSKNWGFVPMTDEEISDIARQIKFFANPDFIYILYKDDKPAAFLLALPDINEILIKIKNGKLYPTGWFRLLFQRKHIKSGRVLLMGVRREFRNQGLDVLLYYQLLNDGLEKTSVEKIELSWILEDNKAMVSILKNLQADPYKRYLILKKMLDE